jgi:hypothetical protein
MYLKARDPTSSSFETIDLRTHTLTWQNPAMALVGRNGVVVDRSPRLLGSIGGRCTARGEMFSDYENATGTGQVHVWFERPKGGWTD